MNTVYVITGQTATGKTSYAISLAKKMDGELISADSRQVYRNMDIITGKDKDKIDVPIHLIDIVKPNESFSSFDFVNAATLVIDDIFKRNKTPIIVGGTFFYIKHLLYGVDIHVEPDEALRKNLEKKSVEELQKEMIAIDKWAFYKMNNSDKNNPRRLVRRIEILKSGKESKVQQTQTSKWKKIKMIGLKHPTKVQLVTAITRRVNERMEQGAVEEVRSLLQNGYTKEDPGLQTIGYKQILEYIDGAISKEKAMQDWITKEVQYAKRQYTFMKKNPLIKWTSLS